MGEKEIQPATPATPAGPSITDGPAPVTPGVASDGSSTQTRDGPPPPPPQTPVPGDPRTALPADPSWSGEVHFPDDYRMGREPDGETYLTDPSGTRASWNPAAEQWQDPAGQAMPDDWSGGHRPTKYTTGPSA